jgi:hypothetical protein
MAAAARRNWRLVVEGGDKFRCQVLGVRSWAQDLRPKTAGLEAEDGLQIDAANGHAGGERAALKTVVFVEERRT